MAQKPNFDFRRNGRVYLNRRWRQFSRLLAAEVCASAVVMLDTPCCEVVWRVLATHSIRQFPLHFPSLASRVPSHFNWTLTLKRILHSYVYVYSSGGRGRWLEVVLSGVLRVGWMKQALDCRRWLVLRVGWLSYWRIQPLSHECCCLLLKNWSVRDERTDTHVDNKFGIF
jgi:hypothetical protein